MWANRMNRTPYNNGMQKVLHVDDEPDLQLIVKMTFEKFGGCDVRSCSNGAEALTILKSYQPDIILLDMTMPVMDGIETIRELKKNVATAGIPVVFVTARALKQDVDRYLAMGAIGCIEKPFLPSEMFDEINSMWLQYKKAI